MSLSSLRKEPHAARGRHQLLETHRFGARHLRGRTASACRAAPLVPSSSGGSLDDQLVVQEALDQAVERAGAEPDVAAVRSSTSLRIR